MAVEGYRRGSVKAARAVLSPALMWSTFCIHMGEIWAEAAALQTENQNIVILQSRTSSLLSWGALVGQGRVSQQVSVPGIISVLYLIAVI